jgi:TorA maturation chaperone TorD
MKTDNTDHTESKDNKDNSSTGFEQICFGLSRTTDEQSLLLFLRLFTREELLQTLIPRLDEDEIMQLVRQLTGVLHKHLEEKEYHELFLGDHDHSH